MTMTAEQAITESITRDRIVIMEYSRDGAEYLSTECTNSVENGPVTEYWGVDEDGNNWRVHMAAKGPVVYHCACGEVFGERCNWSGSLDEMEVIEYMPEQHRASHTAARNSGSYPANGAIKIAVAKSCADLIEESEGEDSEWFSRCPLADVATFAQEID